MNGGKRVEKKPAQTLDRNATVKNCFRKSINVKCADCCFYRHKRISFLKCCLFVSWFVNSEPFCFRCFGRVFFSSFLLCDQSTRIIFPSRQSNGKAYFRLLFKKMLSFLFLFAEYFCRFIKLRNERFRPFSGENFLFFGFFSNCDAIELTKKGKKC